MKIKMENILKSQRKWLILQPKKKKDKKIMKLEIVNKHGELSGPYRNFFRNPLELFLSVSMMINYPMFMLNNSLVLLDVISFLIFKKRLFDFALGTRVVPEGSDHAMVILIFFLLNCREWSYIMINGLIRDNQKL